MEPQGTAQPRRNEALGAILIVAAFFLVALMSALGKMAGAVSPVTLVFFQSFISLMLLGPFVARKGLTSLKTSHFGLHFIRALGGALSQVLMFIAIKHMPLMNAVLLSNSAPLFIPLVAAYWLKTQLRPSTVISVMLGFVGVVVILRPDHTLLENPASLLAVLAAFCSALALVAVNRLSSTESTERILFYYFLTSSVLSAPFLAFDWAPLTRREWIYIAGIGVCMAAAQFLIVAAYRYATAATIAPFNYSVVIFSGVFGWLIWHNLPELTAIVGILLVCAGGVVSTLTSQPTARGHMLWPGHLNTHLKFHWRKRGQKSSGEVSA